MGQPGLGAALGRALRWRCPRCGEAPMFGASWSLPVERCAHCGFAFEREPGYYLLSTWGGSYGLAGLSGIATWVALELTGERSTELLVAIVIPVVLVVALASIRHSKAVFLAVDLWLDPPQD